MEIARVKDIMTDKVVSARPDMPILDVTHLITEHQFNGVPIVDSDNKLIGLITEYSLIVDIFNKPGDLMQRAAKFSALKASDVMDTTPLTLHFDDSYEDALKLFNDHHRVNPVPVIDDKNRLVGVVSRYDLLKLLRLYGHS